MYSCTNTRLGFPTRYIMFGVSYNRLLHQNKKIHKSNLSRSYEARKKLTVVESSLTSPSILSRNTQPQLSMFENKQKWNHKVRHLGYSSAYSWVYCNESNLVQNSRWRTAKKISQKWYELVRMPSRDTVPLNKRIFDCRLNCNNSHFKLFYFSLKPRLAGAFEYYFSK